MGNKRIVVIGAGAAGIRMGVQLRNLGVESFLILEKGDSVGGTWRDNRYPGVACDVPAQYYCYPFAPNTRASTTFATGEQLWSYFEEVARGFELTDHIRFGVEVVAAEWTGVEWRLRTAAEEIIPADIVVGAVGRLRDPHIPDITGLKNFSGPVVHSAQWNSDLSLAGRRVGIVGTGSSAVQILSAAVDTAAHVDLYQRSAQWIYPWRNEPIDPDELTLTRTSGAAAARAYEAARERFRALFEGVVTKSKTAARDAACKEALNSVKDAVLRAKLTPDYDVGCKRLVVSGSFYDAVQRTNVSVVTERIAKVETGGVRLTDGSLRPLDVLVLATGFQANNYLRPMQVSGVKGTTLDDIWQNTLLSYRGVAMPHMPNFFMINGPYSPGGSISVVEIIEVHVKYVTKLIERVMREDVTLAPRLDRSEDFVAATRERAKQTVWYTGGCTNWYLDKTGVPLVNPLTLGQLEDMMSDVDYGDFSVHRAGARAER